MKTVNIKTREHCIRGTHIVAVPVHRIDHAMILIAPGLVDLSKVSLGTKSKRMTAINIGIALVWQASNG